MATRLLVSFRSDDRAQETIAGVKRVVESGVKETLLRIVAILSFYVRRPNRRRMEESYIPRKSHEEECRLEFLRFLHW
jgi:tagatose-1,6-bisphosphate aldolase